MDKFVALKTLQQVAETGGFSKAAERLRVTPSSVTRVIQALEESLGTALVTRSTRKITLTAAGKAYLDQVAKILADLEIADQSIMDSGVVPTGTLRVSVPATYSRLCLAPLFPDYLRDHPGVSLEIDDSDRYLDLATERIDVAVRIGAPSRDPNLVIKKLADSPRFVVASPAYLERAGRPAEPKDLSAHDCARFAYGSGARLAGQRWTFRAGEAETHVEVSGSMIANNLDLLFEATRAGCGISLLPKWLVQPHLMTGSLISLFPEFDVTPPVGPAALYVAYLPNRKFSSKVRTFVNFLDAVV